MEENESLDVRMTELSDLVVGETYPFFGAITKILHEEDGIIKQFELNHNVLVNVEVGSLEYSEKLKKNIFESGIFLAQLEKREDLGDYIAEISCRVIIFGKNNNERAVQ